MKKHKDSDEAARFRDWFEWSEPCTARNRIASCIITRQGSRHVTLVCAPDAEMTKRQIHRSWIRQDREHMLLACDDAYDRLVPHR